MTDLFETSGVPDTPAHWDGLAERVAARAIRDANAGALDWLARSRAGWFAASLVLAASLALLALPARPAPAAGAELDRALDPSDDVGRAILRRDAPPPVATLLLGGRPGGDGGG